MSGEAHPNAGEGGTKPARKSDLRVRLLSAVVMILVAGTALTLGGWALRLFVAAIAVGLVYEYQSLVTVCSRSFLACRATMLGGLVYIGLACYGLLAMPSFLRWVIIVAVIATDSGAYFSGRRFGGPKIAPAISPSKTWAGLYGGMAGAALVLVGAVLLRARQGGSAPSGLDWIFAGDGRMITPMTLCIAALLGGGLAILAQAGDFFESWLKRRAGVKDSGKLIPGHGGLFDRVDGLLAVSAAIGLAIAVGGQ